ncbi:cellulose binding domain-containing protein [Actinoplanes sp. NPDC051346]|uniref:GH12 family glycosyl hydrolase domain-containing protein n=1 Tax=Actinoplanes sp. NPDC051346 TaxID=3155048 RepID=UPI0034481D30
MRRAIRALAAAVLFVAVGLTTFTFAGSAHADTQICEQFGSTTVGGRYVVMNNRWGSAAEQCVNVTVGGFSITKQDGVGNTGGAPVSYPAIYYGCHYANCSPGTNLPLRLAAISSVTSDISYHYVSGATYDAAYDIWLDPTPRRDGVNAMEIMIWFHRQGPIQPVGAVVGTTTVGGRAWEVWRGSNGANEVISYVAPAPIASWKFSVLDFIDDVKRRGAVTDSWYLTSVQAGFEPWSGGVGLAVSDFFAEVTGGDTPASCRVTYAAENWNTGFVATVTIAADGGPVDGWTLGFTLPPGQRITHAWNAAMTGDSGAVSARDLGYNARIPASFGFQGTVDGGFATPTAFTLNGSPCTNA